MRCLQKEFLIPEAGSTTPNQNVARIAIDVIGPRGIFATAGRLRTSMTAVEAHGNHDAGETNCCFGKTAYAKMIDGDVCMDICSVF